MATRSGGTVPVTRGSELRTSTTIQSSPMAQAIHSMVPQGYTEQDVETLVQTITDQIMAAV